MHWDILYQIKTKTFVAGIIRFRANDHTEVIEFKLYKLEEMKKNIFQTNLIYTNLQTGAI